MIYFDETTPLDSSDGVIIPQGIFEKIQGGINLIGQKFTEVKVFDDLLLQREKQILNLITDDKWVCFLIGEIQDRVPQSTQDQYIGDTDLCKRILNSYNIGLLLFF